MSSKKHKRCKEICCEPEWVEEVPVPEKEPEHFVKTPYLLFLILILLIIIFGKEKIVASIKMLMTGSKKEEEVVV